MPRIQLVKRFHLGQIWATSLRSPFGRGSGWQALFYAGRGELSSVREGCPP